MSDYTAGSGLQFSTVFDAGQWVAVDEPTGMYGEGDTDEEAARDLIGSLLSLRAALRGKRLAPRLAADLAYLNRVLPAERSKP